MVVWVCLSFVNVSVVGGSILCSFYGLFLLVIFLSKFMYIDDLDN